MIFLENYNKVLSPIGTTSYPKGIQITLFNNSGEYVYKIQLIDTVEDETFYYILDTLAQLFSYEGDGYAITNLLIKQVTIFEAEEVYKLTLYDVLAEIGLYIRYIINSTDIKNNIDTLCAMHLISILLELQEPLEE